MAKQGTENLSVVRGPMNSVRTRLSLRQPETKASKADDDSSTRTSAKGGNDDADDEDDAADEEEEEEEEEEAVVRASEAKSTIPRTL